MNYRSKFKKTLNHIFEARTAKLISIVGIRKKGPPVKLTRKKTGLWISNLQDIASDILLDKNFKKEFRTHAPYKKSKRFKRTNWDEQKEIFDDWYNKKMNGYKNCIYIIFNNNRKCVYVGRTETKGGRASSHFEKKWVPPSFRIDVYGVKAKSNLSKLECLAIHRFNPTQNSIKAAKHKREKHCPICIGNRIIKKEIRKIFRLRD